MKDLICTATGIIGSLVVGFFGGWTSGMVTLVIFMAIDYFSGLVVAGVFNRSKNLPLEDWNQKQAGRDCVARS